ncbi:hypothetical protein V1517DRAFT_374020 [Lipomyces orientalis]|uniref:Uncharacterized protein n=1 Tax=Lipomyces orientalis TaxID=1233043 RepID=A0ACC3TML5_9ASCO
MAKAPSPDSARAAGIIAVAGQGLEIAAWLVPATVPQASRRRPATAVDHTRSAIGRVQGATLLSECISYITYRRRVSGTDLDPHQSVQRMAGLRAKQIGSGMCAGVTRECNPARPEIEPVQNACAAIFDLALL